MNDETCIHCGTRNEGHNYYMECQYCRREAPGIWASESKGTIRFILFIILLAFAAVMYYGTANKEAKQPHPTHIRK